MIPEARNIDVTGTLQGEKIGMTIDVSSLAKIMTVLTDLYSNPTLAVVREYSTNAFDAHVEAGVSLPIEVTTPSMLLPFFKVRDYGNGLNADDIRDIYSKYGMSTKDTSNEVVGMLGLGCKSALTYIDQFTLTGIKDGVATQVAISRDADGAGSMTIVSSYPTSEASGVEVVVPVKTDNEFADTAANFFRFWEPGTVLVDGKEPTPIDGFQVTEDVLITDSLESSYVVMGNVAYPFTTYERYQIVARVPIGAVQFPPSREALQITPKTSQTIADLKTTVTENKLAAIQAAVDAETDRWEGIKLALRAESVYGVHLKLLSYQGVTFPDRIEIKDKKDAQEFVAVKAVKGYRSKGWSKEKWISTSWLSKVAFFTGYNGTAFTPYKRLKLEGWEATQSVTDADGNVTEAYVRPEYYYLIDKLTKAERQWIKPEQIRDWAEVDAIKVPRPGRAGAVREDGAPSGSYEGYVAGSRRSDIVAAEINPNNRVGLFYCAHKHSSHYRAAIFFKYPNATLVELPSNRQAKFLRYFPKARRASDVVQQIAKKWAEKLTVEEALVINFAQSSQYFNYLTKLDAAEIDDPAFAAIVTVYQTRSKKTANGYQILQKWLHGIEFPDLLSDTLKPYKLLTSLDRYATLGEMTSKHLTIYLNAAFEAGKEQ